MPKRPGRKSAAQTPAPRSERIYGSKKNKPGSASGQSEAKISLSPQIKKALKKKADEFNEKHPTKRVRVTTLEKVFRRGAGAYSKSHRPTITGNVPNTRSAWSFARVNKFLKKKSGQKVKAAYVQDDDLLMDGGEVMAKGGEVNFNDKELLSKYKRGESIGFTAVAHLKAKGLIPRADGTKRKSEKYLEDGGLIAPNGKPSNLTPEQYNLVRTPEFKAWFGDWENDPVNASKVVDENGEPKVMWHYSPNEFTVFNPNADSRWNPLYQRKENVVWFGGSNKVISYSEGEKGHLYKCFLNVKKPIIVDAKNYDVSDYYKDENGNKNYSIQRIKGQFISRLSEVHWSGKKNDNDGVIFQNAWDNVPLGLVVAVLNSNQIKLADGSNTTFDSNSDDIRYAKGGLIAPNGKTSNLTPEQYKLVRTPQFKEWFGDWENDPENASKVVDENGEPLVCYHGTEMTFSVFDKSSIGSASGEPNQGNGFYFTSDYLNAKSYADYYSNTSGGEFPSIVLACFLKANNPLIKSSVSRSSDILNDVYYASQNGYDAFIVSKVRESGEYSSVEGANQIVVFEPEQIKLADGTNTSFDGSNPDIRYNDGGVVFVRNKNYDNSQTIRRLPYRGVSAFAVATDDFEKFKQYAEKEEGVDPSNWQVYDMDDFDNYQVCALKMSETNDYVMGWSDEKPKLEPFDAQEHTMYIDEDGNLDYDDAHEIIILPTKTMDRGGMTAIFVNNMLESAKDIDNIIEYALENDIKPTDPEFNTKVNPDGKYSAFEIRLAKRELKKYSHGGELPMQVTCKKCGWSWNTADSQPQDATMCHKCGFDNVSEDIISMNAPTYLRSLEFAREDAKEDVDLHKVTENAVALSKEHPIRMKEYDELVKLEDGGLDEYADGGQLFSYEPKEYDIQEFICKEQDLADVLSNNGDMTRLGKIRICKAKINLAEDKLKNATSDREVEAWYMSTCIWTDCMNGLKSSYRSGGKVGGCGCYKDGGLAYGNSHDKGGMPLTVKSTGQNIEIEGGEGVVNKRSMQMNKTVEFQGKKLTPCEVVSKINEMGGGVKFKCDDVKKIIAEDGHFD